MSTGYYLPRLPFFRANLFGNAAIVNDDSEPTIVLHTSMSILRVLARQCTRDENPQVTLVWQPHTVVDDYLIAKRFFIEMSPIIRELLFMQTPGEPIADDAHITYFSGQHAWLEALDVIDDVQRLVDRSTHLVEKQLAHAFSTKD